MLDRDPSNQAQARRSRLRRRIGIGVGIVAALGVGVGVVHGGCKLAIELAEKRSIACRTALHETGEGNPDDCRPSGAWFWLARRLPSTRDAALRVEVEIAAAVLEKHVDVAVLRDFDVAARDAAARELVALHRGEVEPERLVSGFGKLAAVGAHELIVELADASDSSHERKLAMRSALRLGDWAAAHRFARMPAAGDYDLAKTSAIVACIVGDRETAAARWRESDLDWGKGGDEPLRDLMLVAVHCQLPRGDARLDQFTKAAVERLEQAYTPEAELSDGFGRYERALSVARMVGKQTEPPAWGEDLDGQGGELLAAMRDSSTFELAPPRVATREALPAADGLVLVAELEAGARRFAELHAAAPSEQMFETQLLRPRESFAWAGYCLATLAATERAWRGQLDEARAIHAVARDLAASEDFRVHSPAGELASLGLLALLEPEAALRVARAVPDADLASVPAELQIELRVELALVYEQAGEQERALELLAGAMELLPRLANDPLSNVDEGARFVHARLSSRAGRASAISLQLPEDVRGRLPDGEEVFALWWVAAQSEPSQQFALRWQAGGESKMWGAMPPWALTSALELLGRAAPAQHRELWLDVVSSDIYADPLDMIRARAQVAEQGGDTAAAERWRRREAALLEPLHDDRAAALYRLL